MKKALLWDLFWLLVFSLAVGFLVTQTAFAEKTKPTLAERLERLLDATHVAPPPSDRPETDEELHERLHEIAEDAAAVGGNADDALLLLAVSQHEADFAADVDRGPCRPKTCDGGHAACMLQIHGGSDERNAQLFADRKDCFRTGLKALKNSAASCGPGWRFSAYASGSCISDAGHKGSAELEASWTKWKQRYAAEVAKEGK